MTSQVLKARASTPFEGAQFNPEHSPGRTLAWTGKQQARELQQWHHVNKLPFLDRLSTELHGHLQMDLHQS